MNSSVMIRRAGLAWAFVVLGVIAGVFAGAPLAAHPAHADSLGFSLSAEPPAGTGPDDLTVVVFDDRFGTPIEGAAIEVSESLDKDFPSSTPLRTDQKGTLVLLGGLKAGPRALTISKAGYTTLSIVGVQSPSVIAHLKPLPRPQDTPVVVSGEMTGWRGIGGNQLSVGLVFKSLSAMDLLAFDPDSFISPLRDTIDVLGPREIPSNLSIPAQDISSFLIPIRVSKPRYRLPIARGKNEILAGVQGTIAVRDILSIVQGGGKVSIGLLNKLNFTRAGQAVALGSHEDFRLDMDATEDLSQGHVVRPSHPPFAADVLVSVATDLYGGRKALLPTDIKLAASASEPSQIKPVTLRAPGKSIGQERLVLTVATADQGRRLSGIITAAGAGPSVAPGEFMPGDAPFQSPTSPESVILPAYAGGLSAAILETAEAPVWYVYALPRAGSVTIPSRKLPPRATLATYAVMHLDFGADRNWKDVDGEDLLKELKRFTRTSNRIGTEAR